MSLRRKGSCYDNARMESLSRHHQDGGRPALAFGKSKLNARRIPQAQALERALQFVGYYNGERPKAGLGMTAT